MTQSLICAQCDVNFSLAFQGNCSWWNKRRVEVTGGNKIVVRQISRTNRAVIHKQHTAGSGGNHRTYGNVCTETAEVGPLHPENRLVRITTAISLHFDKLYAHRSQTGRALYVKLAQTTKDGPDKAMLT